MNNERSVDLTCYLEKRPRSNEKTGKIFFHAGDNVGASGKRLFSRGLREDNGWQFPESVPSSLRGIRSNQPENYSLRDFESSVIGQICEG